MRFILLNGWLCLHVCMLLVDSNALKINAISLHFIPGHLQKQFVPLPDFFYTNRRRL